MNANSKALRKSYVCTSFKSHFQCCVKDSKHIIINTVYIEVLSPQCVYITFDTVCVVLLYVRTLCAFGVCLKSL